MKKVVYIVLVMIGLGLYSCQKEQIVPNYDTIEAPVWENSSRAPMDGASSSDDTNNGGIVDPDDEEDGNDKPNPTGKPSGN